MRQPTETRNRSIRSQADLCRAGFPKGRLIMSATSAAGQVPIVSNYRLRATAVRQWHWARLRPPLLRLSYLRQRPTRHLVQPDGTARQPVDTVVRQSRSA